MASARKRSAERLPAERLWLKIGDTAQFLGISPKDLRYWERVIPEIRARRSQGNLRYYHKDDLPRLEQILHWVNQGISVVDCRALLLHGQVARQMELGLDLTDDTGESSETPEAPPPEPATCPLRVSNPSALIMALRALYARLSKPPCPRRSLLNNDGRN